MLSIRITCHIQAKDPGAEGKALRTGEIQVRSICNVQRIRGMSAMERPRAIDKTTCDAMVFICGLRLCCSMPCPVTSAEFNDAGFVTPSSRGQ